ncbi:DUF805 domain-containing protein [Rhizorhapis sp. SPR117]|uniref:DUF805 domain-containing protein n=1 Tax=Rhizorhapis sp. SPR117 TaxID=2912611 RepID=UPI001F2A9C22|nr:DUF805 domain-containing protein [Rhizorhapis sp. SPR117]
MEWMIMPLRRYAQFSGRARPKEFWMFVLFVIIGIFVLSFVDAALGFGSSQRWMMHEGYNASAGFRNSGGLLTCLFLLGTIIPYLAVAVRRLHDTDRSGWWLLLSLIPLIGGIILLVFFVSGGTRGANRFGADPLEDVATPVV